MSKLYASTTLALLVLALSLSACQVGSEESIDPAFELPEDAPYGAEGWTDSGWFYDGPSCASGGSYQSPCGFTFDDPAVFWAYQVDVSVDDCNCSGEDLGHGPCWSHGTRTYSWYVCG